MAEGKADTTISTPETMDTHSGSATATHGANTNLDPSLQGGPGTAEDRAATDDIQTQHERAPTSERGT